MVRYRFVLISVILMTDRYAVIGNPIAQSKSPIIHAAFARQFGHAIRYDRILGEPDAFAETVRAFMAKEGKGMNVTAPFKLDACRFADRLTDRAQAAQAVNTLVFGLDGVLGDNTDGIGLVTDIQDRLGYRLAGRRMLIIGAGGATRGILLPIVQAEPANILLVNRTAERAHDLAALFQHAGVLRAGALEDVAGATFDVVIHATSAGLHGQGAPAVDFRLSTDSLAYDLAYAAEPTAFMTQAADRGASLLSDGLGMLVGQAAESYRIWRGVMPDVQPVWDLLRQA